MIDLKAFKINNNLTLILLFNDYFLFRSKAMEATKDSGYIGWIDEIRILILPYS
jgi:hypothetical protein